MSAFLFTIVFMSFIDEPNWQYYQKYRQRTLKTELLHWLLEPGSLTVRLKYVCKDFRVEVLTQHWGPVFLSERYQLSIPERQWANIREVKLICDGLPWVFARTIIPRRTLTGMEKKLLVLGNKPLGHILFEHPQMQRSNFEIAEIKPLHYQFQKARTGLEDETTTLYGRRSVFFLSGKPLLVSEVFTKHFPY